MDEAMPRSLQKWEVTRQKGKKRFVLQTGVLAWGVPMFFVMTFVVDRQPDKPFSAGMIAVSAVIWAIGGACFGWLMWAMGERKYLKFLASKKAT